MKRLLALLFVLLLPLSLQAAEPVIHVVIASDGRAGFGANLIADYKNMDRLFKANVPKSRLNLIAMEMDEITPDKILQTVNRIGSAANDTLVFYYSGHAANDAGNGGHYFQLKDQTGNSVELQRRTLLAALKSKGTRLTILLTDCCNIEEKSVGESKELLQAVASPETMSPIFEALFIKPEGTVDITSSKRGEASFVDATAKKRGSCFTYPLVALLEKHHNKATMTWQEFTAELKTEVHKAFLDSHPSGFKFDPPLNGIIQQATQTIEIYGVLPGMLQQPVNVNQGPRFGVRAVNHPSGGVRVTQIFPGGPGEKAGFEVGDIILEINGMPIRHEEDYSKAVDDSPKRMNAKIINVKDGRILNETFELGY